MPCPIVDLVGQHFGLLVAIERVPGRVSRKGNAICWRCACDCGGEKVVTSHDLRTGYVASCGCIWNRSRDLSGTRFGRLVAIERVALPDGSKLRPARWRCRCNCGAMVEVRADSLKNSQARSCGCLFRETHGAAPYDVYPAAPVPCALDGQTFGALVVVELVVPDANPAEQWWRCRCACGAMTVAQGWELVAERAKTCGCGMGN